MRDAAERIRRRIGHDLQTPLTIIVGYASLLAGEYPAAEDSSRRIVEAAESISSTLADLELVLGVASGAVESRAEPVDLRQVVEDAATRIRVSGKGSIEMLDSDWPTALADTAHLTRAVQRILEAACEHVPGESRIRVQALGGSDHAILSVSGAALGGVIQSDLRLALAGFLLELTGMSLETNGDVATLHLPLAMERQAVA
jgi:K+-sensing histidine kinase KdpD